MAKRAKFEVFCGKGSQPWRWRLKAANGRVVAQSEGYKTKAGAERGVDACRRAALDSIVVDDSEDAS